MKCHAEDGIVFMKKLQATLKAREKVMTCKFVITVD